MSLSLVESLASLEYHCSEIKAIVHRIASIVITTISSTRVNAFLFAVRTGKFRSGKFDLDLLPSGHPLAT